MAVTAGAGAGKTRALVARYLSLLLDGLLTPAEAGLSTWDMVQRFGAHMPGGSYGDPTSGDFNDFWGLHLWGDSIDPSEGTEWDAPLVGEAFETPPIPGPEPERRSCGSTGPSVDRACGIRVERPSTSSIATACPSAA